jgi:hypothetical protein
MPRQNSDQLLSSLERDAADELSLLEETGAEFFTTEQLLRLRGQWEVRNQLFSFFQNLVLRIVSTAPFWLVLWGLFQWLEWSWLALAMLAMFPVSFLLFFAGLLFMHRFFRGKGHLDRVGELIAGELQKRKREKRNLGF